MKELVFLVEGESEKTLLQGLLPRLTGEQLNARFVVFEGKQDLLKNLAGKLRGYRNQGAAFIILLDQDSADCHAVKNTVKKSCANANKAGSVVRIACRELESWYLADLGAVQKAFPARRVSVRQEERKYRNPDLLESPSKELKMLVPEYQKIYGSRLISQYLNMENPRSRSFYNFIRALKRLL